jgi:hypothetical protein
MKRDWRSHGSSCGCASHEQFAIRRRVLLAGLALGTLLPIGISIAKPAALPARVAGVVIPSSAVAVRAATLSWQSCPDFLFNHCMRTFVFGALFLQKQGISYNADQAFVAAALHDLGLLPAFASAKGSFEIDGADAAEKFMLAQGARAAQADTVWHAVEMHDGKWPLTKRQGPEAMLVSAGAGCDVDGPEADAASDQQVAEILVAFPRLQFKKRFTALLTDHCRRKPTAQRGTWLEGLCREQVPGAWTDTVTEEIASSPFSE